MGRNQGEHLRRNEVKAGIIEFIISSKGAVPEPEIRKYLGKKYEIEDQGNIKNHLRDLQRRPYSCIEKIPPKPGFANKWDIKKIENLRNIRLHFPEIRLNIYEKSLNIVIEERDYNSGTPNANRFRVQLFLSVSFFDMCLKNNIETLYAKADEIGQFCKGSGKGQLLQLAKNTNNKVYTEFLERILTNPNVWLVIYKEYISDSLKSEICRKSLKFSEDIEMSEETFQKIVEEALTMQMGEISPKELCRIMLSEISNGMSCEIIDQKMFKEMHIELLKIPKEILAEQLAKVLEKMSEEIFNRIAVEENWKEHYHELLQLIACKQKNHLLSLDIIFDHCLQRDIVEGTVSPEEKEFVYEEEKVFDRVVAELDKNLIPAVKVYDNFLIEYFEKCKEKVRIP